VDPILIVDLLAVTVLLAAAMWLAGQAEGARRRRPDDGPEEVAAESTLTSAQVTVSWASGTRADWDRHVRPVLAREFDDVVGGRRSGASDRTATGELMFGHELWPLVDPTARFTSRLDRPGPGRAALSRILERLEAA
jgi:hypothetical protein